MGKFFIYNSTIEDKKYKDVTIIFNPNVEFDFNFLKIELTKHFSEFHQTSAIIFVHCSSLSTVENLVKENIDKIFKSIPKVEEASIRENIFYIAYNKTSFIIKDKFIKENIKEIINKGLASIFIKNGGLVESNGISHHYVFPSGKHSAKFLRTANVLVTKSEIDFIALNTLHLFKKVEFKNIYCDTLSINVIGYSINQYLTRYENNQAVNIESFKSYNGIYNKESNFIDESIFLISASTSGGLVNYIKENHPEVDSNHICILFYLPIEKDSKLALERVLCNLAYNEKHKYGIGIYEQFKSDKECNYCQNQSSPIKILGDSFSLDEPIINTRNINANKYITKSLKDFVDIFKFNKKTGTSLKVSYSDNSIDKKKYNLYIDYENIIRNIEEEPYRKHKTKIDAYINQFVPASLKYIIYLNDEGSLLLAKYIHGKIINYSTGTINIINQSDLIEDQINQDETGSILIVGSCITNGKNLLYLSRFFRNYDAIRLVYFIGINRISAPDKNKELQSNLKYGLYGSENSSFVEIETLNCDNSNYLTPWEVEIEKLKGFQENLNKPSSFIEERIKTINSFSSKENKGGTESIFYKNFQGSDLKIRKNSAFFNDNDYFENIKQSDVYFTIACVLNNMRNNKLDGLVQTNFVKSLLDPFIFNRFNDGIIQASILRAARNIELNYSFSYKNSEEMLSLLKTFIKHKQEYQGEAIFEFLYSLSVGKLRLVKEHYISLIEELDKINDDRVSIFLGAIKDIYKHSL